MYLYTILIWIILSFIYAFISINNQMKELKVNPPIELYANDLVFQIVAFIFTKGLFLLLLLIIILLLEKKFLT